MLIWFRVKKRVKEGREDVLTSAQSREASARPLGAGSEGSGGFPGRERQGWHPCQAQPLAGGSPQGCGVCAHVGLIAQQPRPWVGADGPWSWRSADHVLTTV